MIKLYEHQQTARRLMMSRNALALFMEQGTGKTLPTLFHIAYLFKTGQIESALIVAPLSTMGAWTRDIEKMPEAKRKYLEKVTVINYDKVWRRKEFYDGTWDCIVLDESHSIKHRTSKRSKAVRKMANKSKFRYILTGTPMSNGHLEEYWAQFDFLDPEIFGKYKGFQDKYCFLNQFHKPYRYRNVDELIEVISDNSYRITKEECLDLPEKLPDEVVYVDLAEKKLYKQMLQNFIQEMNVIADNPLVRSLKLRQIASGYVINDDEELVELKNDKIKVLMELLEARGEAKTVIFAHFTYSIKLIEKALKKAKVSFITLNGEQKDKQIWKKFQTDDSIQVIICQYQTANAGVDLFSANAIMFYEPTLSSTINEQAKDRIHRIGQHQPCSYYYLITKGTIEQQIYRSLINGRDFGKEVLLDFVRTGGKVED